MKGYGSWNRKNYLEISIFLNSEYQESGKIQSYVTLPRNWYALMIFQIGAGGIVKSHWICHKFEKEKLKRKPRSICLKNLKIVGLNPNSGTSA